MGNRQTICQRLARVLRDCPEDVVFLAGAGVSRNPPASLPLANDVKLALMDRITGNAPRAKLGVFYSQQASAIGSLINNIFMESMFEIIRVRARELDDDALFAMIAETFGAGAPNNTHRFLARLTLLGCRVITTNFDLLIERALDSPEVTQGLPTGDSRGGAGRILHIHGSVADARSIITTLRQVGQGLPRRLTQALKDALQNKILVVMGWSDNDIDITPLLFLSGMKTVYWVAFSASQDSLLGPHDLESSEDFVDRMICAFSGLKYVGSTPSLVADIWMSLWGALSPEGEGHPDWKKPLDRLLYLDEWDRAFVLLEVLERIDPEKALSKALIDHLERPLRAWPEPRPAFVQDRLAELYCKKSVFNRIVGRFEEAVESAKSGIALLDEDEGFTWLIELSNDIASAYNDRGYHSKTIGHHEQAFEIFRNNIARIESRLEANPDPRTRLLLLLDKAQVHTNLGSTYLGAYDTASHLSASREALATYLTGAEEHYRKGIEIHESLGTEQLHEELALYNEIKLGDLYNNIGNALALAGKKTEAAAAFRLCLTSKERAGDINGKKRALTDYLHWFPEQQSDRDFYRQIVFEKHVLQRVLKEAPVSSTHLLYYKERLAEGAR